LIKSFADKETEKIWAGIKSRKYPLGVQQVGRRKLRMLNNAQSINDLRIPPANRLKKMKGNLSSFHSIRINNQYRVKFIWRQSNAYNVQIIDYHE
jgi:proteic killer suppression protein